MALDTKGLIQEPTGGMYVAPERIFLKPDGTLTTDEEEASGGTLLVAKGCEIPVAEAAKYGLVKGFVPAKDASKPPATVGGITTDGAPSGEVSLPTGHDEGFPKPDGLKAPTVTDAKVTAPKKR